MGQTYDNPNFIQSQFFYILFTKKLKQEFNIIVLSKVLNIFK